MANSSRFVLPIAIGAGGGQPLDDGGVVRRLPALEDLRRAGGGHAGGAEVVLQGDRHAGQRAGVLARRHRGVDRVGRGRARRRAVTRLKAWSSRLAGVDGGEVLLDDGPSRPLARPHRGGDLDGGSRRLAEDRRHAEHAVLGGGRLGQHRVADAGVAHDVVAHDVGQRVRVRGGRHVGQVERLDVGGVLEDRGELRR